MAWIVSLVLALLQGLRTLWTKDKEGETIQSVTKENKELKAENAGIIEEHKQDERQAQKEEEYKNAKGFRAKLKVLSNTYRSRSGRK
ncbi:MAG: hypothetical protein ACREOP_01575 [Thermodesulfobacteriota bacterium]